MKTCPCAGDADATRPAATAAEARTIRLPMQSEATRLDNREARRDMIEISMAVSFVISSVKERPGTHRLKRREIGLVALVATRPIH
jgi:hypothetical protein